MKFRTCPEFSRRYETLVKEDLDCSCAELVFGQTTGQLHPNISEPVTPPHQFLEKLKGYFDFVKPQQTTNHSNITIFVDKNLADCSHVWLRCEKKSHSLQPRYSGPYRVLQRNDKNFTLDVKDSKKVVSIDCVKPVFFPDNENPFSIAESLVDSNQNCRNWHGRCIKMPLKYKDFLLGLFIFVTFLWVPTRFCNVCLSLRHILLSIFTFDVSLTDFFLRAFVNENHFLYFLHHYKNI